MKRILSFLFLTLFLFSFSLADSIKDREKEGLSLVHNAKTIADGGNFEKAFELYDEAAKIFKKLMAEEPNNPNHVQNYKHCLEMPGYIQLMEAIKYERKGDSENAAKYFKAAMEIYGKISKEFPKQKSFENNYKYAKHHWYVEKFKVLEKKRGKAFDFYALKIPTGLIKLHDYKGKVVLLEFWASWCPYSRKSLFMLDKIYKKYKDKGLVVIALSMDKVGGYFREGGPERAAKLSKGHKYLFGWSAPTISDEYGYIDAVPKVFLIDKNGNLYKRLPEKERTEENISKLIEKLL